MSWVEELVKYCALIFIIGIVGFKLYEKYLGFKKMVRKARKKCNGA